jgi:putative DNA methylase
VVVPPYADNVQYSELADFFYVWLKRTQGYRRPEWFSTYLCENDEEAVVNVSRHRDGGKKQAKVAKAEAHAFYEHMMTEVFTESRRVLRDDGVLTVMFTHKKQEAWVSLFISLIRSGFLITATWPVKTESEHSLHQARKNAAQSTVFLVARKRGRGAGTGYFGPQMRADIRDRARSAAERLKSEGLKPIDQLVGSFGPAMEVYSRYDEVNLDTGEPVGVDQAIQEASDAVSQWRIEQLAERGLDGVEPEGRFALLCWDVMAAAEFRFNEARLLGHAAGMDVDRLIRAGLVSKKGDKIFMIPAKDRRRSNALKREEIVVDLFGEVPQKKRRSKAEILQIHPNDPTFRTSIDACQALALRYLEARGGSAGIGSALALVRQQGWGTESSVARLMEALTKAAPRALRKESGQNSPAAKFPEFRAWHALLEPLFGISPPDWTEAPLPQAVFEFGAGDEEEELETEDEEAEEDEEE